MKLKSFFIFYLLVRTTLVNAQNKFWIGASIRPDIANRVLFDGSQDAQLGWLINVRNNSETGKLGFTAGVNTRYNLHPKWSLESGILFSNKGFQTVAIPITTNDTPDPTPNSEYVNIIFNYTFMDVPIIARYNTTINNKLKFNFGLGIINSLNLSYQEHTTIIKNNHREDVSKRNVKNETYKNYLLSSHVSCGIEYMMDDKISFVVEPSFQYGLNAMRKGDIKQHLYTIGLNLGVWCRM